MGQTLTNGIYLPDNGERNCYTGLSQNWQKLDNLIGSHGDSVSFSQTLTEGVEIGKITINGTEISMYHTDYSSKADASNVYTKTEIDTSLSSKADASDLTTHTSNADIHVTSTDKSTWNGKQSALSTAQLNACNSGITSTKVSAYDTHTSNTDVHVTTSDKSTWNAKQDSLTDTQLSACNSGITSDKVSQYDGYATSKANDSDVVHKSGDETIEGVKTFSNTLKPTNMVINENGTSKFEIYTISNGVIGQYGGGTVPSTNINPFRFYVGKARNYANAPIIIDTNFGANGSTNIILRSASNSEPTVENRLHVGCSLVNDSYVPYVQFYNTKEIRSSGDNKALLGTTDKRWADVNTVLLNGKTPSALSLASVTRVKVDTTDFVWDGVTKNSFVAEVPCVVYVLISTSKITENGVIFVGNAYMYTSSQITKNNLSNCGDDNNYAIASVIVNKGDTVGIRLLLSTTLTSVEGVFYRPLLGNV